MKQRAKLSCSKAHRLTRDEPERNIYRYYTVVVQPDLFGTWSVMREWGRIGNRGTLLLNGGLSHSDAARLMLRLVKTKENGGYTPA